MGIGHELCTPEEVSFMNGRGKGTGEVEGKDWGKSGVLLPIETRVLGSLMDKGWGDFKAFCHFCGLW